MSKGMTRTDMVRIRSLAEETRSLVAVKMSGEADVDTSIFPEDSEWVVTPANTTTAKRNASDQDTDEEMEYSVRTSLSPNRQKTESPMSINVDSPTVKLERRSRSPVGDGTLTRNSGSSAGQFHWAVEEDSDDEQGESDQIMGDASDIPTQQMTPPDPGYREPVAYTSTSELQPEDDDEDQELHMSVAKVYEKTIVQLGKTLGETLIDE